MNETSIPYQFLKYEFSQNIGLLTINREDKLNALNKEVLSELFHFFDSLKTNAPKNYAGLIITGAGEKSFIAGADIGHMSELSPHQAEEFAEFGQSITLQIENLPFPVIAAVNGFALGGGLEFALSCDFILCTSNALFALPEVSLGLIPGFGGTQRLTKVLGRFLARKMIYTGEKIDAAKSLELGLSLGVFNDKIALIAEAKNILEKAGRNSPLSIGLAKKVINAGADLPTVQGLKIEQSAFGELFNSFDMKEGTKAFVEKRKPQFKGI